jgi:hypothetical protein
MTPGTTGPSMTRRARGSPPDRSGGWLFRLLAERSVQVTGSVWLVANATILAFGRGTPPFDRPVVAGQSFADAVVAANVALVEVFFLMAVVYMLTRTSKVSMGQQALAETARSPHPRRAGPTSSVGRAGWAAAVAASRSSSSHRPSWRTPLTKNVGVPRTPLCRPLSTSSWTRSR